MQTFKIILAYDGTDFHGWQKQPNDITVHSCVEKAFQRSFNLPASIVASSRTDSGVHALGQVAKVRTSLDLDTNIIMNTWNAALPKSILIRKISKIDGSFNPFHNVISKTYYYHLFLKRPLPFLARYGWLYRFVDIVDFKKFNEALKLYIGEHDFSSFCKLDKNEEKTTIRRVDKISLKKFDNFNMLRIEVIGKSFLRFQIRRMIGYALDLARRKDMGLDYLKNILDNPDPRQILLKAEACGLCLRKVVYKNESNIEKREL